METKARERLFSDFTPPMTPIAAILPTTRLQTAMFVTKTVSILGMAIAAIFTAGLFWSSYRDLPKRTEQNQQNIATLKTGLDSVRSEIREMKTILAESLCLQKAEKLHADWRDCLINTGPIAIVSPRGP